MAEQTIEMENVLEHGANPDPTDSDDAEETIPTDPPPPPPESEAAPNTAKTISTSQSGEGTSSYIDEQGQRQGRRQRHEQRRRQREEEQDKASAEVKKYLPKADTSKFLSKMDGEHSQGVMVMSKRGKKWWLLIVNGQLNKTLPRGVTDYLGDEFIGIDVNLDFIRGFRLSTYNL